MKSAVSIKRCLPLLLLVLLLVFPRISVQGAASGLLLWFDIVLPTLAPFLICTRLIVLLDGVDLLVRPVFPFFHSIFGLSAPAVYVMVCGLLCGYPLGAGLCADFYLQGKISKAEADYLLSICNHPSPMFLLGYVNGQLSGLNEVWILPLCLYLPVLPLSVFSRVVYLGRQKKHPTQNPADPNVPSRSPFSIESILLSTAETMTIIGGYIMLFSILAAWIGQLHFLSLQQQALLSGIAEITTGIRQICAAFPAVSYTSGMRLSSAQNPAVLIPVSAATAFGGLSGIFQTKSVTKNAGLSIRHYVIWKFLHAGLSAVTALICMQVYC